MSSSVSVIWIQTFLNNCLLDTIDIKILEHIEKIPTYM